MPKPANSPSHAIAAPPKRLDPAVWRDARRDWEQDDELTYSQIAERLGVAIPTVTLRAKRELWVKGAAIELENLTYGPMEMVATAVRALMRAANQTKDLPTAVKAAGMLLERTMGRVVTEAKPMMASDEATGAASIPTDSWLTARRLLYQEMQAQGIEAPPPDATS